MTGDDMTETLTDHTYPYEWTRSVVDFPSRGERAVLLWVCEDCVSAEASGELEVTHDHDGTPCDTWDIDQGTDTITPGRLFETVAPSDRPHELDDSDEWSYGWEHDAFSKSPCDACGCSLAGTRDAYTAWYPL